MHASRSCALGSIMWIYAMPWQYCFSLLLPLNRKIQFLTWFK